ncbi:ABC transporter ATP-binding protein [Desulfomarina sp.]
MLLTVNNLNLWFHGRNKENIPVQTQVLHNISFTISRGKTTALVGESGSGKSVTAYCILRLLEENSSVRTTGSIIFENRDLQKLSLEEMRLIRGNRIAIIFQEPMSSLNPVFSVGNQILEPLRIHRRMTKKEAEKEAIRLLDRCGIIDSKRYMTAYPHQLSGGQRQRVMIAMALACRPALLIADEPTTALDVTIQAQILQLIHDIQVEFNMGLLLISHDLTLVKKNADQLALMKNGVIIEQGNTEQLFSSSVDSYAGQLLSLATREHKQKDISKSPLLLETENLSCFFSTPRSWDQFLKREKTGVTAVDRANIRLHRGTTCGIVGESGSGKTTLAFAILKLTPSQGKIIYNGKDLAQLNNRQIRNLRRHMQIVFQDPFSSLSPRLTVEEIIGEGLKIHFPELDRAGRRAEILATLEEVGLKADIINRYPHEFSGGQRQRIAIARSIILKPQLLILDEPTSALDVTIQAQVIDLLLMLQKRHNLTYIFISHDLRVIKTMADYIVVMQNGKIVESGPAGELFSSPGQKYTKTLFQASLYDFQQ